MLKIYSNIIGKNGYPNYNKSDYDVKKEFYKLLNFDETSILKDKKTWADNAWLWIVVDIFSRLDFCKM